MNPWETALISRAVNGAVPDEGSTPPNEKKDTETSNQEEVSLSSTETGSADPVQVETTADENSNTTELTGAEMKDEGSAAPEITNMPSAELASWLNSSGTNDDDDDAQRWLEETVINLQRALRGYDMTAELIGSRLTPNAALIRLRGSDDLTLPKIEKRRQELLTSHAIDVINLLAAPMEVIVMVRRPKRAILRLRDLWRLRELPETAPETNTSLLIGAKEADGELLYLNVGEPRRYRILRSACSSSGRQLRGRIL